MTRLPPAVALLTLLACKDTGLHDSRENLGCDQQFIYYADTDGDGYGDPEVASDWSCFAPEGYVEDDTDCDDTDPSRYGDVGCD